ncbi:MAG: hypothetical protein QM754_18695 [Tepidisphaeraceae bacterium]
MPRVAGTVRIALLLSAVTLPLVSGAVPDRTIQAEVYVKSTTGRATPLRGSLVKFDEQNVTLKVGTDERTLAWTDLTPATAYQLKSKTIDRSRAADWLALGKFGWSIGAKDPARSALQTAVKIDATLKPDADAVLASPAGSAVAATASQPADGKNLIRDSVATTKPAGSDDDTIKFKTATPEEAAEAMARNRKQADSVEKTIGVKLAEFQTDHFVVFTDWDPREYDFLKTNLEGAYRVVANQFNMSPKDNVFVGKLPVYMLAKYRDFEAFAKDIDHFADVNNRTAGYYMGNTEGFGHMAMWKPDQSLTGTNNLDDARRLWAYVLVHEFTHAFLARYKSNVFVPRWLNEGIAEVIAYNQFPYGGRRAMAKSMALKNAEVRFLFNDRGMRPTGEYYPVMQSMVELMVEQNKQGFLQLIDAIKDGKRPEAALQQFYHVDYDKFINIWREWAKRRQDD